MPDSWMLARFLLFALAITCVVLWRFTGRRSHASTCACCGYDTRGLPDAICPECGREATDTAAPTHPHRNTWPLLLAATLCTGGLILPIFKGYFDTGLRTDIPLGAVDLTHEDWKP